MTMLDLTIMTIMNILTIMTILTIVLIVLNHNICTTSYDMLKDCLSICKSLDFVQQPANSGAFLMNNHNELLGISDTLKGKCV